MVIAGARGSVSPGSKSSKKGPSASLITDSFVHCPTGERPGQGRSPNQGDGSALVTLEFVVALELIVERQVIVISGPPGGGPRG